MILNERQYRITKAQIARFEAALTSLGQQEQSSVLSPLLRRVEQNALRSQLESLQSEVRQYENLRAGQTVRATSLADLPIALIQARIAKGMTQKELAERLGLKEQQIQRYEATNYASANLARLTQIAQTLQIEFASTSA
jgi:ribosome-binding protein aMBF1 (putative translation factor)